MIFCNKYGETIEYCLLILDNYFDGKPPYILKIGSSLICLKCNEKNDNEENDEEDYSLKKEASKCQ